MALETTSAMMIRLREGISWGRSHRNKEEHTLNSMKNKWVLCSRDESSYLWLQTLGYTPKFEVALVNACQAQRKIKHSITKFMGAYAILFKVLPCHSDRWFSILPNLKAGSKWFPVPHTQQDAQKYSAPTMHWYTSLQNWQQFFSLQRFFVSPSMMAKLHD